jgi:hypothetical protein
VHEVDLVAFFFFPEVVVERVEEKSEDEDEDEEEEDEKEEDEKENTSSGLETLFLPGRASCARVHLTALVELCCSR